METPRREALQLLGAVGIGTMSGCLDRLRETAPDETTTTDDGTNERGTTSAMQTTDFRWEATILERASKTAPANVELRLINAGGRTVVAGFGPTPPFSKPLPASAGRRVPVLFDPEMGPNGDVPTEREGDCWNVQTDELGIYDVRNQKRLEPDETVSNTYALLAQSGVEATQDGCFADRTYTYTDTVALGANEERKVKLSFELVVENGIVEEITALQPEIR